MAITNTANTTEDLVPGTLAGESKSWNWHPDIPIKTSPLFELPLKPAAIIKWYAGAWLPVTEFGLYLLLALGVWFWLTPPLAEMETLAAGWVGAVWVRNLILMGAFATALHLWLHTWKKQGLDTRYMRNTPNAKHRRFFLGDQLKDNVFYTLASGVTVWTVYECLMWLAYANGVITTISFAEHPIWFALLFPLIAV